MILKELDAFSSEDKFFKAGRAAEEQMAFYLKRFFGTDANILVLNGIRIEMDGDAAQVDHLVIHSHGLVIVESKSVHGKVQIKDDGQWIRWFGSNQSKGIASPITQARLQERFFRQVLAKASGQAELFANFPIDIFVAISDSGIILWPQSGPIGNVCKADQVADKILEARHNYIANKGISLSVDNCQKIASFLQKIHKPLVKEEMVAEVVISENDVSKDPASLSTEAEAPVAEDSSGNAVCKHCGSKHLEIRYSFNYFFYCNDCEKNTAIKPSCPKCGQSGKLRKQKKEFFVECSNPDHSELYFVNP